MEAAPDFQRVGARLVIIGNGSVEALGGFSKRYPESVAFFTDPKCEAYAALGMLRGMGGWDSLKMVGHAIRAAKGGHRQGATQGHPSQQGGVCVFDRGGSLLWAHRDNTAGDNLPPSAVLAVFQDQRKRAQ